MPDAFIERACALAREAHAGQVRKGTGRSYFDGHLEPVARLVAEAGGSDVQVAAAYLHDAAEDAGGPTMLVRIAGEIGEEVADLVEDLSDSLVDTASGAPKEAWGSRKRRYLADLRDAPVAVLEVSVADKYDNARAILDDHARLGPAVWELFNESRPEYQLWYYRSLDRVFRARIPDHPLTDRLTDAVTLLAERVRADTPDLDARITAVTAAFASD